MTTQELQREITHRTEERLGHMGFGEFDKVPSWATDQAEREAKAWAMENFPFDWAQLQKMKRTTT